MQIKQSTIILLAVTTIMGAGACRKTNNATPVSKFSEIKASADFNWSVMQKVNFQVKGLPIISGERNMLQVSGADGNTVYYKQFLSMSDNVTTSFLAPRSATSLIVTYGSIKKTVSITGGNANFNYTQDLVD